MAIYDVNGNVISAGGSGENNKKYAVFGDSIPAFGAYTGGTGTIVDYLQSFVGGTWYNFAIGGTTMSAYRLTNETFDCFTLDEWADSIASGNFSVQRKGMNNGVTSAGSGGASVSSIISQADSLNWSDIDTVVLAFGTNDLGYDVRQVGSASDAAAKNGTMVAALKYAVSTILGAYPLLKIIVCGVPYRYADNPSASEISSANAVIKDACEGIGIKYADLFSEMGINSNNYQFFLYDGTHPSVAGKVRYATTLAKHLYKNTNDKTYTVLASGTSVTFGSYPKSVYDGQSISISVTPASGKTISSVTVTMGGKAVQNAFANGKVSITSVNGDIKIVAVAS